MAEELKSRSEVEKKYTWNLGDLYKTEADWNADVDKVKKLADKLAKYEDMLSQVEQRISQLS